MIWIALFVLYYISGFVGCIFLIHELEDDVTVKDLVAIILFGWIYGPLLLFSVGPIANYKIKFLSKK